MAILLWGGNFVAARFLSGDIPPLWISFLRWSIAAVLFLPFAAPAVARALPQLLRHWRVTLFASLLGIGLFNSFIYWGAQTSAAANLALICGASPLFNLLFAFLLGIAVGRLQLAGCALAVVGVAVLAGRGDPRLWQVSQFVVGDLWMLGGALLWAIYTELLRRKPAAVGMTAFHAVCIALALPLMAALALWQAPPAQLQINLSSALALLYLGVAPSIVCYYLWNAALSRIGVGRVSGVYYALPLAAAGEAALLLGEPLHAYHGAAMALILLGVFLIARRRAPAESNAAN